MLTNLKSKILVWFKKTKNILNVFSELYKNRNELRKNAVFVEFFTIFVKLNIDLLLSDKI
ncbi:TPA: hypothetical protein CPU00_13710 [Candidatus Gastranaerophilales bacterium HUM_18]|nr:MAG TPA: hypothetical protein CPU00_13710 [Candidatus Gastranaerophilales bacterium HUM_18]